MKTELRKATGDDYEFAFNVKKQALGPHITKKWGWDEDFQLDLHKRRWDEKPWFIIDGDAKSVGTVSIEEKEEHVRFGEFYLLPEFQGRGIGTTILQKCLADCDQKNKKTILEYLKWNPVGSLYSRNGFRVIAEDDKHFYMERAPCHPDSG